MVLQGDQNGIAVWNPVSGARLTVTYEPNHISLCYTGIINHGSSYIAYVPFLNGMKFCTKNNPDLMDADQCAEYLMGEITKDGVP
jgi:hypothetical protein